MTIHLEHSDKPLLPTSPAHSRPRRLCYGSKRLTVADIAAIVLMNAPGKMLRISEIAAGAQKMFAPRFNDPKALSTFRSSLRHELSKFRDGKVKGGKFFRVPKEHGRAGRGDLWAYVGDGDPETRALIDRIIEERGEAKDYSRRQHTFQVVSQTAASDHAPPKEGHAPSSYLPAIFDEPIAHQPCPLIVTHSPTPIFHPAIQPQPHFTAAPFVSQYLVPPDLAFSPASVSSETFDIDATSSASPSSTAASFSSPMFSSEVFSSQSSDLSTFDFLAPSSYSPLLKSSQPMASQTSSDVWELFNICFGDQSFPNS